MEIFVAEIVRLVITYWAPKENPIGLHLGLTRRPVRVAIESKSEEHSITSKLEKDF